MQNNECRTGVFHSAFNILHSAFPSEFPLKYMLLIYMEERALSESERADCYAKSTALAQELAGRGQFVGANPLQPISVATSVRVREGKRLITDGPFAETREQLGGYFLVDARDLNEAIEIASRIPGARVGTVEIRPIVELTGLPGDAAKAVAQL
jgi:hypothetical protein